MVSFIVGAISIAVVFLFGSVGEIITEKSGHLNLGIPGIMCMGAAGGALGLSIYYSGLNGAESSYILTVIMALVFAIIFSAFGSVIYGFLTVTLRANQNVTGLALTTFGAGFAQFVMNQYVNTSVLSKASKVLRSSLSFADSLGGFGEIFLGHGILVYLAIALAVVTAILLKKSRIGLHLRAVGENPATADAVGINVMRYKYLAIIIGGAVAGLGGLFYVMDYCMGNGILESCTDIQSFGWMAIALVIFTVWKPDLAILGSFVFGALYIIAFKNFIPFNQHLLKLLPYIITVIVLIFTSIFGGKGVQPPASLGVNYFREER